MTLHFSRREFLTASSAALLLGALPKAWAEAERPALPIPPLLDGRDGASVDLKIRKGQWSFKAGQKTQTLGFNQDYLGPTIRTRKGSQLHLHYQNTLDEAVAVHGHGLHVPGTVDGGPQLAMAPGEAWQPTLPIVQQAATCWYHSHTHGHTGEQVYRGLAGLIIIDDDNSEQLALPNRYGVDDLPIIIQDKSFDAEGQLHYSLFESGEDGWYGDTVVINGAIAPKVKVPAGKIRLRLLNGANARFYIIRFEDNRVFHKVACDGGFLESPVALNTLEIAPGERCEIIVDMSDGQPAGLLTLFEDEFDDDEEGVLSGLLNFFNPKEKPLPPAALLLETDKTLEAHQEPLPEKLNTIVWPKPEDIKVTREFTLTMEGAEGNEGHMSHAEMDMGINGEMMDMRVINERVKKGQWERWRIRSDVGAHPFHIHGCSFLIEQMEGEAVSADQAGWKDMVVADDDDWSEILVRFDYEADDKHPYMYHCHILEHEDRGMMGQFTVT